MKLFFDSSLTGRKDFEENYQAIFKILKNSEHEVIAAPVFTALPEDVAKESIEDASKYFDRMTKIMKKADIHVYEVSYPSLGVGHQVAMSISMNKPVIVLHVPEMRPFVLESMKNDRLQVIDYNLENLESQLKSALDYASGVMDTRFNFFISPRIANYLDWIAKTKKTPRAVYLRDLIQKRMETDKEYQA